MVTAKVILIEKSTIVDVGLKLLSGVLISSLVKSLPFSSEFVSDLIVPSGVACSIKGTKDLGNYNVGDEELSVKTMVPYGINENLCTILCFFAASQLRHIIG